MNSPGSQIIFSGITGPETSETFTVDNDESILLMVTTGAGTPTSQYLYVYGSIGIPGNEGQPIDPDNANSPTNPYTALMVRDLNDLDALVGTDGIPVVANTTKLYEINVNAVRDVHFKMVGSAVPVTAVLRSYRRR